MNEQTFTSELEPTIQIRVEEKVRFRCLRLGHRSEQSTQERLIDPLTALGIEMLGRSDHQPLARLSSRIRR